MKTLVLSIFSVFLIAFAQSCNQDINQSQNVKIIEERDPVIKIIEERDSIVIINRKEKEKAK